MRARNSTKSEHPWWKRKEQIKRKFGRNLKLSKLTKYRYIKEMLKPYAYSIRELPNTKVSINKKMKTLQNPNIGEGLLETAESVVIPLLKKSKRT